jgi:hypothetical protein
MSVINWITPRGDLGTLPESQYYYYQLAAEDSDEQPLVYSLISGSAPAGVYVSRSGELRGVPTLVGPSEQKKIFSFTIRATNPVGNVADRFFSITVSNTAGPQFVPRPDLIGAWFDGTYLSYQFTSVNNNVAANNTYKILQGTLPPGITLTSDGLLSGFLGIIASNSSEVGYEVSPYEFLIYDNPVSSTDKYFNFSVQVSDGTKFDTINVRLLVVSKGNYTADNSITLINNTFITIDANNKYNPIIINSPDSLPTLIAGSTFAYKFLAYDPEDEDVSWTIDTLDFFEFDSEDPPSQIFVGNGTTGPFSLTFSVAANATVIFINSTRLTAGVDYTIATNQLTFVLGSALVVAPTASDTVTVQFITATTGFDSKFFDQGAEGLPPGLTIDTDTGWVFGQLPNQTPEIVEYSFLVVAFRTADITARSVPTTFTITVQRTVNEEIVWNTNDNLGLIDNGAVSQLYIEARNTLGKLLSYSIDRTEYIRLPQGIKLLPSGRLIGRTTFNYFSLDGQFAVIDINSTQNLTVGMTVQGVGVQAGCKVTQIIDSNTLQVSPAIYLIQGSTLTIGDIDFYNVTLINNSQSTSIDGGDTTFDRTFRFTVKTTAVDNSITDTKTFSGRLNVRNLVPYENLYLKAFPSRTDRLRLQSLLNDASIFIPANIYRPDDSNFGLQQNLKFLFLPGVAASDLVEYVNAIDLNHYQKNLVMGDIKTARAVDNSGAVIYEVVYVEVTDLQSYGGSGPEISTVLDIENKYLYNGQSYGTLYPNSFPNMETRLKTNLGLINPGALPGWMTSVQENGRVLGLIRAVVLGYFKPGTAKITKFRLEQKGFDFATIPFKVDRYQLNNYLSQYFNIAENQFNPGQEVTFDSVVRSTENSDKILTTLSNTAVSSNSVVFPDEIKVGYGWNLINKSSVTVPVNTFVTSVSGNLITFNNAISGTAGQQVEINGQTTVDYTAFYAYNQINGKLTSLVRTLGMFDGIDSFVSGETVVFAQQENYTLDDVDPADGWRDTANVIIPGYLDKVGGLSSINQRGGVWQINTESLPSRGFDDLNFDAEEPNFLFSRFDQGSDSELTLTFKREILLNQLVFVRTGSTYTQSTLIYSTQPGSIVPFYYPFTAKEPEKTTFDGGGTRYITNRDKYIETDTLDKYIKFPQIGVFV